MSDSNSSEVVGKAIEETIEERERRQRRAKAIDALREFRKSQPKITAAEVARARRWGRP